MNNHRRTTNLLTAGTIVALLLLIYLAFDRTSWTDVFAAALADTPVSTESTVDSSEVVVDQQMLHQLQEQNIALQQTVEMLTARDTEYRTTIAQANETIQTLENRAPIVDSTQTNALQQRMQALQTQNSELARVVQLMQEREAQYQSQLQAANAALQTQAATGGATSSAPATYQEHEHEEHERYEHEGYEHDDD